MRKIKLIYIATCLVLFGILQPSFTQIDKTDFSKTILNSEVIIQAKVNNTSSQWTNDSRGKHIYTRLDLEVLETVKGDVNQKNISIEIAGGQVGKIKEVISESFSAKKNDELILFLQQNPLRVFGGNKGVMHASGGKVFLKNNSVNVSEFLGVVSEMVKGISESKSIEEIEKEILQKRVKIESVQLNKEEINFLKKVQNEKTVESIAALPNLQPYKPGDWGDQIVVKNSTVTAPIGTQLSADDSPLYDSDDLYVGVCMANVGSAGATNINLKIYVDDTQVSSLDYSSLDAGYYVYWYNVSIGTLSIGTHSVKMVIDESSQITESNESDNQYTKSITIQHLAGTPLITSITPSTVSAGTGSYVTINGSGFGSARGTSIVEFFYQSGEPKIEPTTYVSWSDEQIVCDVPIADINDYPASASSGPVTVTTSAGKSNGYNIDVNFSYGGVKWEGSFPKITYKINENLSGVTGEGSSIQSAMNSWTSAGANFNFVYGGSSTATSSGYNEENSILFGSTSGSVATNSYWYDTESNIIVESDIVFNSGTYSFTTSGRAGTYDIESIAIHELGHSLNLRDLYGTADNTRIMYGFGDTGEIKRSLSSGEVEGIKYIYGTGGSTAEYTISGIISMNSIPLSSVNVSLTGTSEQNVTTSSDGVYSFTVIENGDYTITPTKTGYVFSPGYKSFSNVTSNQSQNFNAALETFIITASAGTGGTIVPSGNVSVYYDSSKTFQITEEDGYHISQLLIDSSSTEIVQSYKFSNVKEDHTIEVLFSKDTLNISASGYPSEGGTIIGGGNYEYGTDVTVIAEANEGYSFVCWTEGPDTISYDSNYAFTATINRTLIANFLKNTFNVVTACDPNMGGTATGYGNYEFGTNVTVVAFANNGYKFLNWTEGSDTLSNDSSYTFVLKFNRSLVAHFSANTYNVSTSSESAEGGSTTGRGNYEYGTNVTVVASANTGYDFKYWMQDSSIVSEDSIYTFTITADCKLVAHFSKKFFSVTASCNPASGGTITGTGNYEYGSTLSLTAIPNGNYKFWNWTESEVEVSTDSNYQFIAENNRILVANLDRPPQFITVIPPDQVVIIHVTPIPVWWSFQYSGIDEDNDEISFSLIEGPNGSEISKEGLFKWSPTVDQSYKTFNVIVNLSDGKLSVIHSTTLLAKQLIGDIDHDTSIPAENMLYQNYPNPFNPTTLIKYVLTNESNVKITIYNIAGQRIENVLNGIRPAGYHTIEWKSNNYPSGIYIYTIEALPTGSGNPFRQNRKMILLK